MGSEQSLDAFNDQKLSQTEESRYATSGQDVGTQNVLSPHMKPGIYMPQPVFIPLFVYVLQPTIFAQNSALNTSLSRYNTEKQRRPSSSKRNKRNLNTILNNENVLARSNKSNRFFNHSGKAPRASSGTRDELNCITCKTLFGLQIFQCNQGHSSCKSCKEEGRCCGICGNNITTMRNYAVEAYLAEQKVQCPYTNNGCKLFIKMLDMDIHIKECPFKEL